ncbi:MULTISPECIES: fluoride efflux transporter CrcB [unclassified Staphylococcus]|uniref:fluoride efflux transporter CrcB n=1 Tax=unclassified Staphylococcus TaxID=91994 RepID=UPI0021D105D9|nr:MULTISPECIES: fluoride efflux transporter CrcB [unclassified Staphylococcus]UXR75487.1 fluoride efflux transporter CrcB [Staphylococcus sp. IVB6233]UXR79689.1 fluoride efflux transporter CrcB [Staphylococcus sp. IVB6218]
MKYFMIFIGGSFGALLRYTLSFLPQMYSLPIGTFVANLLGAFLMGLFTATTLRLLTTHPHIKKGLTTGFIGALTTFSTFQYELIQLFDTQSWVILIFYGLLSYIGGLISCFWGYRLGVAAS